MKYELVIRSTEEGPLYTRTVAVQLARISMDFLLWCEREGLIRARRMTGGSEGYSRSDVARLARIRRLHQDLGLNMTGVEVALHLREQVLDLIREMESLERQMTRRERELLEKVARMRRRLAGEGDWR
jgi:DNA-binding transcriptional MerR regulator